MRCGIWSAARRAKRTAASHTKCLVPAPLHALLAGTNPFAFNNILRILVVTGIDPAFARSLIRESPDLLLAHAGAEHQPTRVPALAFLRAVSGEDFGTDVDAWTAWVEGLSEGH